MMRPECFICERRHFLGSNQLELELDDSRAPKPLALPWKGRSPRVLTSAFKKFSLGAPPAGGLRD